ncbi:hypothetical protein Barb6_01285 [Bacteroidales bacterium Barb6]|nr:hypothetical protein Barb6_01285 [Bacteroidales bacterium Barb6]
MRNAGLWFVAFLLLLCACDKTPSIGHSVVLAYVGERTLTLSEVTDMIPKGTEPADSLIIAESIIKKWVKDALIYDVALRNLSEEKTEINRLVEDYRRSLVRYRYQERLIKEKLASDIRESEKLTYYEVNRKDLILDRSLIKGLFLKVPVDAPGLSEVKEWYRQSSESTLEKIEKYSVQNAVIYDYFYDRWVDFDDIMSNIPLRMSDPVTYLKTHRTVEVSDSSFCYLLKINEYVLPGSESPYEYASQRIVEMLTNQRKVTFLKEFEDDLYNDAIRQGKARVLTQP